MYTSIEENYLKAILHLHMVYGEVNVNELSKKLNIKMPSVTNMMKKFSSKGLVHYEQYKPLRLTEKGRKEASLILRKHRLIEMYLVEKLQFGWDEVHAIAEQIEHVKSPLFFDKMDAALGFPSVDPHGSPIPDKMGRIQQIQHQKLSDCKIKAQVKIIGVSDTSDEFLKYLTSKGIALGTKIKIIAIEPFDHSMIVQYNKNSKETFSHIVCQRLMVC